MTCLGNCRGEQECATRCFARFGSEKLNDWLSCTLEEKKCVVTGVKQDTSAFYATAPQRLSNFDRKALEGKWWKVRGYNAKYDCFPCQVGRLCGNRLSTPSTRRLLDSVAVGSLIARRRAADSLVDWHTGQHVLDRAQRHAE